MRTLVLIAATLAVTGALASPRAPQSEAGDVEARPIAAPARPLPGEEATAGVTRFSFIASGPSRSGEPPEDGQVLQREHGLVVNAMLRAASRLPVTIICSTTSSSGMTMADARIEWITS
jgi:hypothetical protein